MAEPVVVDRLPVELTPTQQATWDSGEGGKRLIRKEIRQDRLDRQYSDEEIATMEKAPSFDEVVGGDF